MLLAELADRRAALETDDLAVVEDAVARLEVAAQRLVKRFTLQPIHRVAIWAAVGKVEATWQDGSATITRCSASIARDRGRHQARVSRLARKHHPDVNPKDAGEQFREINEAYAVLSDREQRARYDRWGYPDDSASGFMPSSTPRRR